jgi:large subunit ribosomal protein L5
MRQKYESDVVPALCSSMKYENPMRVPRIEKIVVNVGFGTDVDRDQIKVYSDDLAAITGQRPVVTKARKSIANFKLRAGMPVGLKVTLRGTRMYEFLDRLLNVALPRIRDFRGVPVSSFDQSGNYSLGLREQTIFPEIDPDQVKSVHGMDITFVTTAETADEARELLKLLGMPFANA